MVRNREGDADMKRGLCLLIAVIALLALTACGSSEDQPTGSKAGKVDKKRNAASLSVDVPKGWKVKKDEEYGGQLIFHGDADEDGPSGEDWTSCIIDEEVQVEEGQAPEDLFDEYTRQIEQQIRDSEDAINVSVKEEDYNGNRVKLMYYQTPDGVDVREAFILMGSQIISMTMDSTIAEDADQFEDIVKSIK